jgi:hypothetical protein
VFVNGELVDSLCSDARPGIVPEDVEQFFLQMLCHRNGCSFDGTNEEAMGSQYSKSTPNSIYLN